jgi:biofilm protein TabA
VKSIADFVQLYVGIHVAFCSFLRQEVIPIIFSDLSIRQSCESTPPAVFEALEYLRKTDFSLVKDGEYPIMGKQMFAKVFSLVTLPVSQTRPELHKKYIDVQYWISGREKFGIAPYRNGGRLVSANKEQDLYFYEGIEGESFVLAQKGDFAVFYPWDAHRPGTFAEDMPEDCRKVVVKVSVELLNERGKSQ